ncbi:MAG: putative phage-associated protein [Lentimonas sp.]|jgi:uncharacterized phage-associated protein
MNEISEKEVSAQAVANKFLEMAEQLGGLLTNMQLQKLVYIANGFHLGFTGKPLTFDKIHAWQFGPVIPCLYKTLQKFGNGPVTGRLNAEDTIPGDSFAFKVIDQVWQAYGRMSGSKLSALTHLPGSPWHKTWERDENRFGVISVEMIADHYRERLNNVAEK